MPQLKLDNTKRSDYSRCPRYYYYQHVLNLRGAYGSTALRFGVTWHAMMEAYYQHVFENGWTRDGKALEAALLHGQEVWEMESKDKQFFEDYRTLQNGFDAFMQYIQHYAFEEGVVKVIDIERLFEIPIDTVFLGMPNVESFIFQGKIDLILEIQGQLWVVDHKTTGWQLEKVKQELEMSPQFLGYSWASKNLYDTPPDGFLVRLLYMTSRKSPKTGEYGKLTVQFDQAINVYSDQMLDRWLESICYTAGAIQRSLEDDHWPMNFDGCNRYGRCTFMDICKQGCHHRDRLFNFNGYIEVEPWDVAKVTQSRAVDTSKAKNPVGHVDEVK